MKSQASFLGIPRAKRTTMLPARVFDKAATACRRLLSAFLRRKLRPHSRAPCGLPRELCPNHEAPLRAARERSPPSGGGSALTGGKQAPACRRGYIKNTSGEHSCAFRSRNSQQSCPEFLGFLGISRVFWIFATLFIRILYGNWGPRASQDFVGEPRRSQEVLGLPMKTGGGGRGTGGCEGSPRNYEGSPRNQPQSTHETMPCLEIIGFRHYLHFLYAS